jgi:hypothetical protein
MLMPLHGIASRRDLPLPFSLVVVGAGDLDRSVAAANVFGSRALPQTAVDRWELSDDDGAPSWPGPPIGELGGPALINWRANLNCAYIVRLRALAARLGVELHALTFIERTEAGRLNSAVVHEHVSAATVDLNEAEALFAVEPFWRFLVS